MEGAAAGSRRAKAVDTGSARRDGFDISKALGIIRREVKRWKTPVVTRYSREGERPAFRVLISCLLSLRTRDEQTAAAARRLFAAAAAPRRIMALPEKRIEELIYPVGFYRNKARVIKEVCRRLVADYGGAVPDEIDELLKLKGVGRKTANLVVTMGFGKPGICVDTHVHRIVNIWGYVRTAAPDKTELALREKLPRRHWIEINDLLVTYGQNVCKPVSPLCSKCAIHSMCPRAGVTRSR
ncbi:MAG: endonuclease III domain-containing protein [Candidatus Nitrospinota bacterium M3_3B_026]